MDSMHEKQLVRLAPLFLAVLALLATTAALSSCGPTRPPRGIDNPDLVTGSLTQANPLDIVVMPIQNNTGRANLPLAELRKEFHAGLIRQRYSPLALEYVDQKTVEASYAPGALDEQAILQVIINNWDDSQVRTMSRLQIQGEVYLLDPKNPDPRQPLWGGKVDRRVDLTQSATTIANPKAFTDLAVKTFAADVLASLPPRNPERTSP